MNNQQIEANKEQRPTDVASGAVLGCDELQKTAETLTLCLDNWGMINNKFTLDTVTHVIKKQLQIILTAPSDTKSANVALVLTYRRDELDA